MPGWNFIFIPEIAGVLHTYPGTYRHMPHAHVHSNVWGGPVHSNYQHENWGPGLHCHVDIDSITIPVPRFKPCRLIVRNPDRAFNVQSIGSRTQYSRAIDFDRTEPSTLEVSSFQMFFSFLFFAFLRDTTHLLTICPFLFSLTISIYAISAT